MHVLCSYSPPIHFLIFCIEEGARSLETVVYFFLLIYAFLSIGFYTPCVHRRGFVCILPVLKSCENLTSGKGPLKHSPHSFLYILLFKRFILQSIMKKKVIYFTYIGYGFIAHSLHLYLVISTYQFNFFLL